MAVPAAGAATSSAAEPGKAGGFQGEQHSHAHKDAREGRLAPSPRQRSLADARGVRTRFNAFGTPAVVTGE